MVIYIVTQPWKMFMISKYFFIIVFILQVNSLENILQFRH